MALSLYFIFHFSCSIAQLGAVQDSSFLNPRKLGNFSTYCNSDTGIVNVPQNSIIFQKQTSCRGDQLISSRPSKPWKNLPPLSQLHPLSSLPSIFSIDTDKAEHPAGICNELHPQHMWLWCFLLNKHGINHARHSKWKCYENILTQTKRYLLHSLIIQNPLFYHVQKHSPA